MIITGLDDSNLLWAQKLNSSEVPFVNFLSMDDFAALVNLSAYARITLTDDGKPSGLLVGFLPGAAYQSANYRWVNAQYDDFFYIDRIIIDGHYRNQGLARHLYDDAARFARDHRKTALICEVNSKPANKNSLAAHARMGFLPVGRASSDDDQKEVVYLRKGLQD